MVRNVSYIWQNNIYTGCCSLVIRIYCCGNNSVFTFGKNYSFGRRTCP